MSLFQKKYKIEDLNNITQKVLASNSYSAFSVARKDISPRFEKLKFRAPKEQITSSSVQGLIDDLNQRRKKELEEKENKQREQKQIIAKKAEARDLKKDTQEFRMGCIIKKDQLSQQLLEIRNNKDLLLNEKILPLENEYEKLVNDHKSIFNIGNIFGDSPKINKGATDQQKKEIEEQLNKNYADNNGKFYEDQSKLLGYMKGFYGDIQQNKYLSRLQEMGEVVCDNVINSDNIENRKRAFIEHINNRKRKLEARNRKLDKSLSGRYFFESRRQQDQQERQQNGIILNIYNAMGEDRHTVNDLISLWQGFDDKQKSYLSKKDENKSLVGNLLPFKQSLYSSKALENEEKGLSNSTYFKNKAYNEARIKIIKKFEENYKLIDEEDKKIDEKEKEIEAEDKKIEELGGYIKQLDEIISYTPSMAVNIASAIKDGANCFINFISKSVSQNPVSLIRNIKNQNESMYKRLYESTADIYKYLENLGRDDGKRIANDGGFYDFTQTARYKVFCDNCLEWKNSDCVQYYEYLSGIMSNDSLWDNYIYTYYNQTNDKSKLLELKRDMIKVTRIASTSVSDVEKCLNIGEELCKKRLEKDDDSLSRTYKEMTKSINSIYIYIGGNSSKEIKANDKYYNNIDKFQKLKASKKENTLKVYDENLGLIDNFKRLSTGLNVDLYNINSTSLDKSQKACKALIDNIGVKQAQAQEFDEKLKKRKTQIEKETNGIRDFAENQVNQKGIMKAFVLPQLPKSNLTKDSSEEDYLKYYDSYFNNVIKIDQQIRDNFSNNKKLFKENPYFTKIWVQSMRSKVNSLKESSMLKYTRFKTFAKNDKLKNVEELYKQSMKQLEGYGKYFNGIENGTSLYNDVNISILFTTEFWTDLRSGLNELVRLLQNLGIEGDYKEIFSDISLTKVLKYLGTFIRFRKYWIENITPKFLDFKALSEKMKYNFVYEYNYARSNKENIAKSAIIAKDKTIENAQVLLYHEFFDNTKLSLNAGLLVKAWNSKDSYPKIMECFNKIDKAFNEKKYETKRKYDEKKENSSRVDFMYDLKLDLMNQINKQNAKNK